MLGDSPMKLRLPAEPPNKGSKMAVLKVNSFRSPQLTYSLRVCVCACVVDQQSIKLFFKQKSLHKKRKNKSNGVRTIDAFSGVLVL